MKAKPGQMRENFFQVENAAGERHDGGRSPVQKFVNPQILESNMDVIRQKLENWGQGRNWKTGDGTFIDFH
jgi:hypothetical protein